MENLGISFDLTVVWALILALSIYIYVVLDGFDLGLGILYPLFREKKDRDLMMNSVAPVWDGNETWQPFRWPTRSSCPRSTRRSSRCYWR